MKVDFKADYQTDHQSGIVEFSMKMNADIDPVEALEQAKEYAATIPDPGLDLSELRISNVRLA
jgi:hypothetical protein